jgi:hypothetical protein
MSRICPGYVPDMSRTINRAGHIWSIYGGNAGESAPGPAVLKALQCFKQKGFIAANLFVLTSARWPNERIGCLSIKTPGRYRQIHKMYLTKSAGSLQGLGSTGK